MKYLLLLFNVITLVYFVFSFTSRCGITNLKFGLKSCVGLPAQGADLGTNLGVGREHLPKKVERVKVNNRKLSTFANLPFTDREEELIAFSQAAINDEFQQKDDVMNPHGLTLSVSGRLWGSGKTVFGLVLHQVISNKVHELKPGSQVHYIHMNDYSPSLLKRNLRSLKLMPSSVIDAPDTITDVMYDVTDYLAANNPDHYLFLHFDEFALKLEDFYNVWKDTLFPIQQMKHVFMYISGRNAYFDQIGKWRTMRESGKSLTKVLNAKLNSLGLKHMKESIEAIDVCSDDETQSLSLHDKLVGVDIPLFTPSQRAELDELWNQLLNTIYDSSGGVPLIVQLLLKSMFECQRDKIFDFSPARAIISFDEIQSTIKECIEQVKPDGSAGMACMKNHRLAIVDNYNEKCVLNLLRAVLLTLKPLKLSLNKEDSLDKATLDSREIIESLALTDDFGFARYYDSDKGEIQFKLPGVVKGMLQHSELYTGILKDIHNTDIEKKNITGLVLDNSRVAKGFVIDYGMSKALLHYESLEEYINNHIQDEIVIANVELSKYKASLPPSPRVQAFCYNNARGKLLASLFNSQEVYESISNFPVVNSSLSDIDLNNTIGSRIQIMSTNDVATLLIYYWKLNVGKFHVYKSLDKSAFADYVIISREEDEDEVVVSNTNASNAKTNNVISSSSSSSSSKKKGQLRIMQQQNDYKMKLTIDMVNKVLEKFKNVSELLIAAGTDHFDGDISWEIICTSSDMPSIQSVKTSTASKNAFYKLLKYAKDNNIKVKCICGTDKHRDFFKKLKYFSDVTDKFSVT